MIAAAYHRHRIRRGDAAPSIAPLSRWDLVRLLEEWLRAWPGLADFLLRGVVVALGRRRA